MKAREITETGATDDADFFAVDPATGRSEVVGGWRHNGDGTIGLYLSTGAPGMPGKWIDVPAETPIDFEAKRG